MLLKETIDRMRFDMDEMRNSAVAATGGSGQSSATNTLSKSLGAELLGKMKGGWGMDDEEGDSGESSNISIDDDEDTESEDVVQTIITRKRVRVHSFFSSNECQLFPPESTQSCK